VDNFIKQNWIAFKFSQTHQKNSKILRIPNLRIFFLALVVVEFLGNFVIFSLYKSYKTYLETMQLPGGRNWQLISPQCIKTQQSSY
jgi:hypothetical protein